MDPQLVQVAQISWSRDRQITEAEGACELVLGLPAGSLLGSSLHRVLGISEDRARELDRTARGSSAARAEFISQGGDEGGAPVLRLVLGRRGELATAAISNLRQVLAGAPPIQIGSLSSSLSHEIRNPLSSVKMAVQTLARNSALSDRDRRRLAIANREIRTMERMLWLFAEYGRDAAPAVESVPLRTLVQEAAALVEPELAERRIQVRPEGEATARVQVEAGRMARILSQTLLNVAMAMPEGGILKVEIHPGAAGGFELRLLDPSAAEPKDAGRIFEPFGSPLSRGAGLSLAALHRVMERHGGRLSADWSKGQGTLYTLTFPG
jgi:signal transduction histidine kinase